jgi:hypothetical protein
LTAYTIGLLLSVFYFLFLMFAYFGRPGRRFLLLFWITISVFCSYVFTALSVSYTVSLLPCLTRTANWKLGTTRGGILLRLQAVFFGYLEDKCEGGVVITIGFANLWIINIVSSLIDNQVVSSLNKPPVKRGLASSYSRCDLPAGEAKPAPPLQFVYAR